MKRLKEFKKEIVALHRDCLKQRVVSRLKSLIGTFGFTCPIQRLFLRQIQEFVDRQDGLVASADVICRFVRYIEQVYFKHADPIPEIFRPVNRALHDHVFVPVYENFCSYTYKKNANWGGPALMRAILENVKYCPYCNAEMVYSIERDAQAKDLKSAFDHFFPKGRYPFLAVSLYNLIPSCHRCNSDFKGDEWSRMLNIPHLYLDDLDDMAHFVPIDITGIWDTDKGCPDLQLTFVAKDVNMKAQVATHADVFGINLVYRQLFNGEAVKVIRKAKVLNENYVMQIRRWFESAGLRNINIEEMIYGTPIKHESIDLYHMSKLKIDLYEQSVENMRT